MWKKFSIKHYKPYKETIKVWPITRNTKKNPLKVAQTSNLLEKDFKSTVLSMLKELKEIKDKELKETRRRMSQQTHNRDTNDKWEPPPHTQNHTRTKNLIIEMKNSRLRKKNK